MIQTNSISCQDPFVPCFTFASQDFASRAARIRPFAELPAKQAQAALSALYFSAVFDKAAFALYAAYRRSGLPYRNWIARFDTPESAHAEWTRIFDTLPELAAEIGDIEARLEQVWQEFSGRVSQDFGTIQAHFGINRSSRIKLIDMCMSDPHNGHRTVVQIQFTCGRTIFYKPRSLDVDLVWRENLSGPGPLANFMFADTLAMQGYGYQDCLPGGHPPRLGKEVAKSTGELLAVAWLLNASDLHTDNVVFQGRKAGIIDLETMLTPVLKYNTDHAYIWRATNINSTLLFSSDITQASAQFKASTLGAMLGSGSQQKKLFFGFTAEREVRPTRTFEPDANTAIHRPPEPLVRQMQHAFTRTCQSDAVRNRLRSFVERVAEAELRYVPRDTSEYYKAILELNLPKYLANPEKRATYIDERLSEARRFDQTQTRALGERLVKDEYRQILAGDIPVFKFVAGQKSLILGDGQHLDMFSISAVDHAKMKLGHAEAEDIREQSELISATFGYRFQLPENRSSIGHKAQGSRLRLDFSRIAERIMAEAVTPDGAPSRWFSVATGTPPSGNIAGFGDPSGFKGALGIYRALEAYLTCEPQVTSCTKLQDFLTREAENFTFSPMSEKAGNGPKSIGLEGILGNLQAAGHLLALNKGRWQSLEGYVAALIDELISAAPHVTELDVISGFSGAIIGLQGLSKTYPPISGKVDLAMASLGRKFARNCRAAMASDAPSEEAGLLADIGFAHGISGAFAAACLLENIANPSVDVHGVKAALKQALSEAYERWGYWPDLRGEAVEKMNLSWCNGRVGVARALQLDPQFEPAFEKLSSEIWQDSQSDKIFENGARFCCGASGSLDLFIDAKAALPNMAKPHQIETFAERILARCVAGYEKNIFDRAYEHHTANLYYGKSGILYTGLRALYPSLPSLSGFVFGVN